MEPRAARQLTFHGAVVTLVGLLAGIPYSMVATERILGSERAWRFAHVGNILGGLILIAVAGVVDRLDLGSARSASIAPTRAAASRDGFCSTTSRAAR